MCDVEKKKEKDQAEYPVPGDGMSNIKSTSHHQCILQGTLTADFAEASRNLSHISLFGTNAMYMQPPGKKIAYLLIADESIVCVIHFGFRNTMIGL